MHAAADTFHGYPRYLDMLGGEFRRHGPETTVALRVKDPDHPVTRGIRPGLSVVDEIYQFQRDDPGRVHLSLALARHPETGGPGEDPLGLGAPPRRGRVFSTALGHRADVLEAPWFQTHLLGGIPWALGLGVSGRWAAPHA